MPTPDNKQKDYTLILIIGLFALAYLTSGGPLPDVPAFIHFLSSER